VTIQFLNTQFMMRVPMEEEALVKHDHIKV